LFLTKQKTLDSANDQSPKSTDDKYYIDRILLLQEKIATLDEEKFALTEKVTQTKQSFQKILEKCELSLSSIIKESVQMGKSIKSTFLDKNNNLLKKPNHQEYTDHLDTHTKSIEKFKTNISEIPEQKSILRIEKHTWNVHQFYIDMLNRFIQWVQE
jgi:hypothetical protein